MEKFKTIAKQLLSKWKNEYVIFSVAYLLWMVSSDTNSWKSHNELSNTNDQLRIDIEYYEAEIAKDKKAKMELKNPKTLEKFARENYHMKKDNEDIYIIEK